VKAMQTLNEKTQKLHAEYEAECVKQKVSVAPANAVVHLSVCLSVCNAVTFKCVDLECSLVYGQGRICS